MADSKATHQPAGQTGKTLLYVVDDEPMLLDLASRILSPAGYEVQTFTEPQAALEAFRKANPRPDLIITDYAMRQLTGLDLIHECRRIYPKQKMVLLSGTVDESVFFNASAKPNAFLAKPYEPEEIVRLVKSVLAS